MRRPFFFLRRAFLPLWKGFFPSAFQEFGAHRFQLRRLQQESRRQVDDAGATADQGYPQHPGREGPVQEALEEPCLACPAHGPQQYSRRHDLDQSGKQRPSVYAAQLASQVKEVKEKGVRPVDSEIKEEKEGHIPWTLIYAGIGILVLLVLALIIKNILKEKKEQ